MEKIYVYFFFRHGKFIPRRRTFSRQNMKKIWEEKFILHESLTSCQSESLRGEGECGELK